MLASAAERAPNELAVARSGVHAAGLPEQVLAGRRLELAPERPRALQQRDVIRVLVVSEPDNAGEPGRRAVGVPARERLEADDLRATPREVRGRCAAVRAEADHDDVGHAGRQSARSRRCRWIAPNLGCRTSSTRRMPSLSMIRSDATLRGFERLTRWS